MRSIAMKKQGNTIYWVLGIDNDRFWVYKFEQGLCESASGWRERGVIDPAGISVL
jgi:hypothetical protein